MPFAPVSNMQMFYNEYGSAAAPPLLLIHGSGETGVSEWKPVVEGLAKTFRVIAPDLRGHGKTLDPRSAYTFDLHANDMAELMRGLKISPALVVGHSNGGNVALVLTVKYPRLVKKSVVMAGNAFVSDDLLRYAQGKWSDHITSAWGKQLAKLHDGLRYEGYWRELMDRTGREIARAPNYTAADLRKVKTPVYVIQGHDDPTNAPGRHAEFMADHIPNAVLWLPANTGHSVHKEHPAEWVRRVTKFLRQDPA